VTEDDRGNDKNDGRAPSEAGGVRAGDVLDLMQLRKPFLEHCEAMKCGVEARFLIAVQVGWKGGVVVMMMMMMMLTLMMMMTLMTQDFIEELEDEEAVRQAKFILDTFLLPSTFKGGLSLGMVIRDRTIRAAQMYIAVGGHVTGVGGSGGLTPSGGGADGMSIMQAAEERGRIFGMAYEDVDSALTTSAIPAFKQKEEYKVMRVLAHGFDKGSQEDEEGGGRGGSVAGADQGRPLT
jgi:hypothetical protein